jgi:hypothetical protein
MSAQLRQQTLSFNSTGRPEVGYPRPGSKAPAALTPAASAAVIRRERRRRKVGGINEAEAIQALRDCLTCYDAGDPDSDASSENEDDVEPEYGPSSDNGNFDQALHGNLDVADENIK